jgi:hypothetical protein
MSVLYLRNAIISQDSSFNSCPLYKRKVLTRTPRFGVYVNLSVEIWYLKWNKSSKDTKRVNGITITRKVSHSSQHTPQLDEAFNQPCY